MRRLVSDDLGLLRFLLSDATDCLRAIWRHRVGGETGKTITSADTSSTGVMGVCPTNVPLLRLPRFINSDRAAFSHAQWGENGF